jgi:hypothetical protein
MDNSKKTIPDIIIYQTAFIVKLITAVKIEKSGKKTFFGKFCKCSAEK